MRSTRSHNAADPLEKSGPPYHHPSAQLDQDIVDVFIEILDEEDDQKTVVVS